MAYNLVITHAAQEEAEAIYLYYEIQSKGLGDRFMKNLTGRYQQMIDYPEFYGFLTIGNAKKRIRKVIVPDFPYSVIFQIKGNDVIVHSVHNHHKKPKKKF